MKIALDIETTGLDFLTDPIVAVGVAIQSSDNSDGAFVWHHLDNDWHAIGHNLNELIDQADEVIVHNSAFDLPRLNYQFGVRIPRNVWDTLVGERMLNAGLDLPASLDAVIERRFQISMDKELSTSFKLNEPLRPEQKQYILDDIYHLFDIQQQQDEDITDEGLEQVWDIEYLVTPVFCKMIAYGVKVDRKGLSYLIDREREIVQGLTDKVSRKLTPHVMKLRIRKFDEQKAKLDKWLAGLEEAKEKGKPYEREYRDNNKRPPKPKLDESEINLSSPQQLSAVFKDLGWDIPTTGTDDMKKYLPNLEGEEKEMLKSLIDYRKHNKMVTAFGDPVLKFLDDDDILHGQFQQYGTQTGRPTCKEPNLLQMPSTQEFRSQFIPRPGYKFVVADYSQMELRLMAELSQDQAMMEAFANDLDLHKHTAALMYGTPYDLVTDKQRTVAKTINFMVLYGGGQQKLRSILAADGIYITDDEAKKAMQRWHHTYHKASKTIKAWGRGATRYGFTETAMGRKRRFVVDFDTQEWEIKGIERQGANHVIQGSNADITKMAMVLINQVFERQNIQGNIVLQIYDEIVAEVPEDKAETASRIVEGAMTVAAQEVLHTVPVKVNPVVADSWVK